MFEFLSSEIATRVATGLTLGSSAASAHGILSGYALGKRVNASHRLLETLDSRQIAFDQAIRRLEDKLFQIERDSVRSTRFKPATTIDPEDTRAAQVIVPGTVCLLDRPLDVPPAFLSAFMAAPDNFLSGIVPFGSGAIDRALALDPTMQAWHFRKDGQQMIGFVKRGFLEQFIGVTFSPSLPDAPPQQSARQPARQRHPAVQNAAPHPDHIVLEISFRGISAWTETTAGYQADICDPFGLEQPGLTSNMLALQRTIARKTGGAHDSVTVLLPNEQLRSLDYQPQTQTTAFIEKAIVSLLDGATPYSVDELVFAWRILPGGQTIRIAAVACETILEAKRFLADHGIRASVMVGRHNWFDQTEYCFASPSPNAWLLV